ncbi:Phosphoacetylglucosamine mutase [Blattella germanica]|nr:Phosphoacetylglucosamine mutase [Blattella germanica]
MDLSNATKIGLEKHTRAKEEIIQYGTAGFRTKAESLDHVLYRMGLLAVLRSKSKGGAAIGLMITASHNPEPDNAVTGIRALGGEVTNFGVVTTPMLHFFVACTNTKGAYGEPTEEGYFKKLITAFKNLRGSISEVGKYSPSIIFDGANGVGAIKMKKAMDYLGNSLKVKLCNDGEGKLNHMCGADYVKMQQCAPSGIPDEIGTRCVSVDGDADRIVYYYTDADAKFHLLDGDRIASLKADTQLSADTLAAEVADAVRELLAA